MPPPSAIATGTTPGSDCLMLAKTLRLSDKWTKTVRSVAQMPPPSATPDTPTDTAPGFDYDVSALCWGQRTISRCPASAPSITGQFVSNVFNNKGLYGVFAPGLAKLFKLFWSTPDCSTGEPPPRITMPGLAKLFKIFWSTTDCSTGEPSPRITMPTPISTRDLG